MKLLERFHLRQSSPSYAASAFLAIFRALRCPSALYGRISCWQSIHPPTEFAPAPTRKGGKRNYLRRKDQSRAVGWHAVEPARGESERVQDLSAIRRHRTISSREPPRAQSRERAPHFADGRTQHYGGQP